MDDTNVTIVGASGRMGAELLIHASDMQGLVVTDGIVQPSSDTLGDALGPNSVEATADMDTAIAGADVVIDFSTPQSCLRAADLAASHRTAFVSGTTGLDSTQVDQLKDLSSDIPIVSAANFSIGVNVIEQLIELATAAVGDQFDVEILEAHHRQKVDAPSGTAFFLAQAAARARQLNLDDVAHVGREGRTGPRSDDEIGFQVVRGGDIVGEHTAYLCGPGERIELTHRATDRGIFARGALRAARWITDRPAGWYSMQDVLFD